MPPSARATSRRAAIELTVGIFVSLALAFFDERAIEALLGLDFERTAVAGGRTGSNGSRRVRRSCSLISEFLS